MADVKRVYTFGNKEAEGNGKMRELLGGKGANLAEMNLIGIPVPPGFTITTEVCAEFYKHGKEAVIEMLRPEVEKAMKNIEKLTGMKFGDKEMPLLVSVRSGARASMPGMMDTILNLGMNDQAVEAVAKRTGNPRFAWDSYRRFVQMYGDVVLGMKPVSKEDHDPFEVIIEEQKAKKGVKNDTDLTTDDLKELVKNFKAAVKKQTGEDFPACPWDQLWGAVCAVFGSWMNDRAILYRKLNNIPAEWGTAVTVQAMVFGNMGSNSATGVAFSRDAATGENLFNGEDVAGFRLGTSRPVHWINPENKRISPLILHPLAIMECSLNEPVYMNLGYEGALAYSTQLIKQVASANGELVLLWHNDSITTRIKPNVSVDWQRKLFAAIIEELIKS